MNKLAGLLSLFLTAASLANAETPQTATPPQDATPSATQAATTYSTLVERLKAGDRTVDFTALRLAFTETPDYRGVMMGYYQSLWRPLSARDFEGTLKTADAVLQRNYIEPNAHMVAAIALGELGQREKADFHRFIANGLLRSITSKGDGKTSETAFEVIDISEEYAYFRSLNLTLEGQAAGPGGPDGRIVDLITVVDTRTNEERVIFFSVDNPDAAKRRRATPPQ